MDIKNSRRSSEKIYVVINQEKNSANYHIIVDDNIYKIISRYKHIVVNLITSLICIY